MFGEFKHKLRRVLAAESISDWELCAMLGADQQWLNDSEPVAADFTMRLLKDLRLRKYTLWLMINKIAPESGQIEPDLAHYMHIATTY